MSPLVQNYVAPTNRNSALTDIKAFTEHDVILVERHYFSILFIGLFFATRGACRWRTRYRLPPHCMADRWLLTVPDRSRSYPIVPDRTRLYPIAYKAIFLVVHGTCFVFTGLGDTNCVRTYGLTASFARFDVTWTIWNDTFEMMFQN